RTLEENRTPPLKSFGPCAYTCRRSLVGRARRRRTEGGRAMAGNVLDRARRRVGIGLLVVGGGGAAWALTPGLPVLWGPGAGAAGAVGAGVAAARPVGQGARARAGLQRPLVRRVPLPGGGRRGGRQRAQRPGVRGPPDARQPRREGGPDPPVRRREPVLRG